MQAQATSVRKQEDLIGMEPERILAQVRNTAPFIFTSDLEFFGGSEKIPAFIHTLRAVAADSSVLQRADYFRLCLSAHYATVATFVPTDLDQTIRLKLWKDADEDELKSMAQIVCEARHWDDKLVSERHIDGIGGHFGEWLTVAVPALVRTDNAFDLSSIIEDLFIFHDRVWKEIYKTGDWINLLKISSIISHNLGDFDRALDMWTSPDHSLRRLYKLGHRKSPELPHLYWAGELNRLMTSTENHRHYGLRQARSLRKSRDLLVGMGPFFDSWGKTIARHPQLELSDVSEIVDALIESWVRLNEKLPVYGYARALAGIFGNGVKEDQLSIPAVKRRLLKAGKLREMLSVSQSQFEGSWSARAKKLLALIMKGE